MAANNVSKTQQFRFWRRWIHSGAVKQMIHWHRMGKGIACGLIDAPGSYDRTFSNSPIRCPKCEKILAAWKLEGNVETAPPFPGFKKAA